ncbi:hypothetical protein D3878_09955 [Noviherbaspirillum sedimenti]|uniref:Phasin domain-containing protein n=2 Tax=Noviherbaspirillum sedimenti TaxID=2320865 RepID=A0A3A3G1R7_9BURK|nr:hypothetical protein D3878_09955 [Noviherbaspirillum sedimenti]
MFTFRDHFSDASQSSTEIQIDLNTALYGKLLDSARRFADLNAPAARASLQEAGEMLRQGMQSHSTQELTMLAGAQARASSRRAAAYACNCAGIAAGTHAELIALLGAQMAETNTEIAELVADISRSAPGEYSRFIHAMQLSFDHANARLEQIIQASRQVLDTLETNCIAAARQFDSAARQVRSH